MITLISAPLLITLITPLSSPYQSSSHLYVSDSMYAIGSITSHDSSHLLIGWRRRRRL